MIQYNSKDYLISAHIPKCGGTSFEKVLQQWFGFGYHPHHANHISNLPPVKAWKKLWLKKFIPIAIHGHFDTVSDKIGVYDFYPNASQFITVLREPLELQMSNYFFTKKLIKERKLIWHGKTITDDSYLGSDIDEHLETQNNNWLRFLPWNINDENYVDIIESNFIHIGVTEDLQKSVDLFAEKLGKKKVSIPTLNTAPKNEKPSESSIKKFQERHQLEYKVYNYALKLNC